MFGERKLGESLTAGERVIPNLRRRFIEKLTKLAFYLRGTVGFFEYQWREMLFINSRDHRSAPRPAGN